MPTSTFKSMTGFGAVTRETENYLLTAEVKSLNSKSLDLSVRLPRVFSDKEIEVRNLVSQQLDRGKISLYVDMQPKNGGATAEVIDEGMIVNRFEKLSAIAAKLNLDLDLSEIFKMAYQWPANQSTGISTQLETQSEEQAQWPVMLEVIKEAIMACDNFRTDEGVVLQDKLLEYGHNIGAGLERVKVLEVDRIPRVRQKLDERLEEFKQNGTLVESRLEQEMIYYLEKLDIAEEIVRLSNHLEYYSKTILTEPNSGKKLNFIAQELGREINTIGSKSNDTLMQQAVVMMKEELEKIKEQSANVL